MTPEQITRNFVCDPALTTEAKQAIDGLEAYPALSKFLQAKPLDTLMFFANQRLLVGGVETLLAGDIGVPAENPNVLYGGLYNPHGNIIAINAGYKKDQRVQQRLATSSLKRDTATDTAMVAELVSYTVPLARLDTVLMIHEISHMIDYQHVRKSKILCQFVSEAAGSAYSSRRFVSQYAATCPGEWFAETMSAYVVHPETLKDFDPLAFAAMRAALKL